METRLELVQESRQLLTSRLARKGGFGHGVGLTLDRRPSERIGCLGLLSSKRLQPGCGLLEVRERGVRDRRGGGQRKRIGIAGDEADDATFSGSRGVERRSLSHRAGPECCLTRGLTNESMELGDIDRAIAFAALPCPIGGSGESLDDHPREQISAVLAGCQRQAAFADRCR